MANPPCSNPRGLGPEAVYPYPEVWGGRCSPWSHERSPWRNRHQTTEVLGHHCGTKISTARRQSLEHRHVAAEFLWDVLNHLLIQIWRLEYDTITRPGGFTL